MTWSAPMERTVSIFAVLHTPVTSAPKDLAICTANIPTPPEAPTMRTFCWGLIPPASRRAWSATHAEVGTVAACSKLRLDPSRVGKGLGADHRRGGYGCRLLEGEACRLGGELAPSGRRVLGEGAVGGAEFFVARLKPRHVFTDRLDRARDIHAPHASL